MLAEMLPIRDPFFFGDGILRAITELDKWLYVFFNFNLENSHEAICIFELIISGWDIAFPSFQAVPQLINAKNYLCFFPGR